MNPVVRVDKTGAIPKYIVRKIMSDEAIKKYEGKFLEDSDFKLVLKSDADVYTEEGELLVRFRKNVLPKRHIEDAYEAIKQHITLTSTDRGVASGSNKGKNTGHKRPVMSNILGYFDKWSIMQRHQFKVAGMKPPTRCRITRFTGNHPEKWAKVVPLIQDIDTLYKKLCPKEHASQIAAAKSTPFHIPKTSFSTVTTNLNFRTAAHHDSGDWDEGFGNLVVIERGAPYAGAYTGFPQYGIAVDCRTGDFLAMDVHRLHGNCPMVPTDETSQRVSLVCYLRKKIVEKCQGDQLYDPKALHATLQRRLTRKKKRIQE